jgi:hypothetical protein
MLALSVVLCLLPLALVLSVVPLNEWLTSVYLMFVAVFIFREYLRRMEYTGILLRDHWLVSLNIACLIGFILYIFN